MLSYTDMVKDFSDDTLSKLVEEIFQRTLSAGQLQKDSALLEFFAKEVDISLAAFEKVCLAEFIWRQLSLDKTHLALPKNWVPGSDTYDYLADFDQMSVRERN